MALAGIFWLCYLRLLLPLRDRLDLAIEVVSSCADVFCFVGALVLNIVKTDNIRYTCVSAEWHQGCGGHVSKAVLHAKKRALMLTKPTAMRHGAFRFWSNQLAVSRGSGGTCVLRPQRAHHLQAWFAGNCMSLTPLSKANCMICMHRCVHLLTSAAVD